MTRNGPPTLSCGALSLTLLPDVGGSIARFEYRAEDGKQIPVLRGSGEGSAEVLAQGSFPLVPYSNRIREGRFTFRGREVRIARNMAGDPNPLHGQGWLAAWEVVRLEEREAELRFVHEAGEWPWRFEARQVFTLDEDGLTVVLTCTNLSDEPMPCGLGQHPYFPCTPETILDTNVESVWTIDEQVMPVEKVAAQGRYDLRNRRVAGQDLDNGFGGWSGHARVQDPSLPFSVEMSSPDANFFQLYSPPSGELFVIEPVSHANAALNEPEERWAELGLRVLEPGETMTLTMRLDVTPVQ
ncbi:MAG TPA: aldose 1-epimerase [Allosphingosinicella sp.]|jgi:aldose 1-epimerase